MVIYRTSVIVDQEQDIERKKWGVSWRYLIGKGLQHMNECQPRLAEIALGQDRVRRASTALQLMHYLQEQHPKILDDFLIVNGAKN